jgi:hypothetical protein
MSYTLTVLPGHYAICQLPPTAAIPIWANGGDFCAITRTHDELSIICAQETLPNISPESGDISIARNWALLRVEGPFAFDVTGVLAALSAPLAQAGIVLLAVATFQTDYLLVKAEQLEDTIKALVKAGHRVTD